MQVSMNHFFLLFGLSFLCLARYNETKDNDRPEVKIHQGMLKGITLETNHGRRISAFLGIPYAQPPTGNLRFANPVPAQGWKGTRNANTEANMCPQMNKVISGDEDCLYLNVYTPKLPQNTRSPSTAVMVYIHGGAFNRGSSVSTKYGPRNILDEHVVLVTLNYRLGPLGFLSTGDRVASGNWGLKDQVLALKWVQDNIEYFGGNPNQVTLFGQSAGAACVHLLTLSDLTIGLFHRYIIQSGSALAMWAYRPRAAYASRAFEIGKYVGCSYDSTEPLINCLRKVNFTNIIATRPKFLVWNSSPVIVWGPTDELNIEGALFTENPQNLYTAGRVRDLPRITGVVRDEGLLLTSDLYENDELFDDFLKNFDSLLPVVLSYTYLPAVGVAWVNAIKSYYFNDDLTADKSLLRANLTTLIGDSYFYYPTYNGLRQELAMTVTPQYVYVFDYRGTFSFSYLFGGSTVNYGVAHSDDLIYLFPFASSSFSNLNETMSETDCKMIDVIVKLWTSFAINGTPTLLPLNYNTTWDPYSTTDNYLQIGNESDVTVKMQHSFFKQRKQFWADLYATIATPTIMSNVTRKP